MWMAIAPAADHRSHTTNHETTRHKWLSRGRLRDLRSRVLLRRAGLAARPLLRCLPLLPRLALHVDAAAEVSAFRDGDAGRDDVAVHGAAVANLDLFGRVHVPVDLAEHDQRLGEHLGLDLSVWTDREHVVLEFDFPLDLPFDREVFAAVQLALDDDRFTDVHHVPPSLMTGLRLRRWCRAAVRLNSRGRGGDRRLYRFITLPHGPFPPPRRATRSASMRSKSPERGRGVESPQSISAARNCCLPGFAGTQQRWYDRGGPQLPCSASISTITRPRRCCRRWLMPSRPPSGRSSATRRASIISGSGPRRSSTRPGAPSPG